MKTVAGIFNATGSDIWICIGFVPDWVRLIGVEGNTPDTIYWSKHMRDSLSIEGLFRPTDGGAVADYALGEGLKAYHGGEELVSGSGTLGVGTTTFGSTSSVYLKWDDGGDYRRVNSAANGIVGDAVSEDITTWTLDSSTTKRGHFNADVTGTYIGDNSRIVIDGKVYTIYTLAAASGNAASEVYLTHPAPSGDITFIGGKYDMKSYVAGEVTSAGFMLDSAPAVNTSGETVMFEAGTYDRG